MSKITITITHVCDDEDDVECWVVSDDGGEFDDETIEDEPDVQTAVDARDVYYKNEGFTVETKEIK